ncbi:MAG: hypothetical protein B6A08_10770 [Sorangiineae bacterium NIC37A_2]|jgi:hypothetical protein|nr:MAG: hypothetical protein B6A08_10770 [Sorangiineae bacterium NIC37A_2]
MKRLGTLLVIALVAAVAYHFGKKAEKEVEPESSTLELTPTPTALTAVRRLARLETAQFNLERVIDLKDQQKRLMGTIEAQDAILLVAAGTVSAGIDFTQMEESSARVDWPSKSISITLPPASVFSVALDEKRTYVHTRKTDVLATRRESLETEARREAERGFLEAAKNQHLLSIAETNADKTVRSLLESLGFERIEIRFAETRPGE